MPTDPKPALFSLTIWGIIFSTACTVFPAAALWLHLSDPGVQSSIETLAGQIGTVVGLAIALYGRIRAVAPIAGVVKAPLIAAPSLAEVETIGATVVGDLADPPKPPSVSVLAFAGLLMFGAMLIGSGALTACSTLSTPSSASVQLNEGKALATIVTASDALAVTLDAGAKSGAISGPAATTARQALMDLQTGLALAQQAFLTQDGTAAQKIALLASLLDEAEKVIPVSASTSAEVSAAIAAAVAVANTY